jgi:hypothetical protein
MNSLIQPPLPPKKGGIDLDLFLQIVLGTLGTVVVILGVWMGIKFAMGPGSTMMKSLGDSLGRSLAGGYQAIKKVKLPAIPQSVKDSLNKTRRNLGNRLRFGPKGQDPDDILPVLEPEKDIEITNPLFKSKDDFLKFQERHRTRRNIDRQKPKKGTIGAITNLPSTNLPAPAPAPSPAPAPAPSPAPAPAPSPAPAPAPSPAPAPAPSPAPAPAPSPAPAPAPSPAPAPAPAPAKPNRKRKRRGKSPSIFNLSTPEVNPAIQEIEDIERGIKKRKQAKSNALRKISAKSQSRKLQSSSFKDVVNRARAVDEIDQWDSPAPAPAPSPSQAPAPAPAPASAEEPKKTPLNARWTKMLENKNKNSQQKPWNPSTKIDSVSRLGKGRKRRNRRKTGHHLRNRKKTGRKI